MNKKVENALLAIWGTSLVATLGSLYFSEIRGYIPCDLCWYQRIFMYPIVLLLGMAIIKKDAYAARYSALLSGIGGIISLYHYSIQKVDFMTATAPACGVGSCTGQYINWLGFITIPFLALIAFTIIFVLSMWTLKQLKGAK